MSTVKVGINGFGRIGRTVFRAYLKRLALGDKSIEIVAVNNPLIKGQEIKHFLHMLKNDTVHGRLEDLKTEVGDGYFMVNGKRVSFNTEKDPATIDWSKDGVQVVVDSTGIFKDKAGLGKHLKGTVKKVVMSAPGDDLDATIVMGVNNDTYDKTIHHIVSNASCTTNCLAPVAKVIDKAFGIEKGLVTTCHAITNDQKVVDSDHSDLRRARAASVNMILTTTGAAKAVGIVLPHLKGKLDGMSIRVPILDVSIIDASFILKRDVTTEEVNKVLKDASESPEMKGILGYSEEELVSSDYIGNSHSSIIDSLYTKVMGGNMLKVMSWYDNEFGYSCRVLDLIKILL